MERTLAAELASLVQARQNCLNSGNTEWYKRHTDSLHSLVDTYLPSGGGIDGDTCLQLDRCTANKLVIYTEYHHMNDNGFYDGWTYHYLTVRPAFQGLDITVSGQNRNDVKDYLAEVFSNALTQAADWNAQVTR